jgi:hypothetical protein
MRTALRLPLLLAAALLPCGPALSQSVPQPGKEPPKDGPKKDRLPLDQVLKGAVLSLNGNVAEVFYDLVDPAQLEDFTDYRAFHLGDLREGSWKWDWYDRSIRLAGTGSMIWKPILRKRVEMGFEVRMKTPRDFGAYLAEDRVSEELTVYSIYDQFFQNKDHRGQAKTHMICRMTAHAPDAGGDYAFRYITRSSSPNVGTQKNIKVRLGRDGTDEFLEIDSGKLNGGDANWPVMRGLRPGFYVIDSEASVSSITIKGEIDPKWAESVNVDLSLPVKPRTPPKGPEREPTGADLAARQRIDAVLTGADAPAVLVPILGNGALLDSVREDAAKAMEDAGDMKVVPRLVASLESAELPTRRLAFRVVHKLTGKSFSFAPEGAEEGRRKAVRALLDYIEKNPGKFK